MSDVKPLIQFRQECKANIEKMGQDEELRQRSLDWNIRTAQYKYTYNFNVLGRPIIQFPQDIVQLQEVVWSVKPDLIIETGIAHGGSLILSAAMLSMLDYCEAVEQGCVLDPNESNRRVLGIDIEIRPHNLKAIEEHPLHHKIDMLQGSSIDTDIINRVHEYASKYERVLVILDSNHTHEHVLEELRAYAPLTTKGSYCIVFDTVVEDLPDSLFPDRPWGQGNNPKTAVMQYLDELNEKDIHSKGGIPLKFEIDKTVEQKLLITVAPDGYLRRIE
ncbi:cephalosporin hydroxylase family protein [Oleiphilus messinensis]|uniref:cephalosporin hydroxylase family protein n=1 Tax=Oleiphilus messinensis TaxID=141451 RepID=UPI001E3FA623|nr:cephalosporin hydroxylase family protein [Oleiphilus messinensis]